MPIPLSSHQWQFSPNVCVGQHCTALYCPALNCTILYCTKPHDLNGTVSSQPVAVLSPHAAKHCLYYLLITNTIFAPLFFCVAVLSSHVGVGQCSAMQPYQGTAATVSILTKPFQLLYVLLRDDIHLRNPFNYYMYC